MKTLLPLRRSAARAGFSLAELMVVIVIIGLLAGLVIPNVMSRLGRAYLTTCRANIKTISEAVDQYAMDHGMKYPDDIEALVEEDQDGNAYLSGGKVPKDPWGMEYMYEPPSGRDKFRVYTYGKDGVPGGEGEDTDYDNHYDWSAGE